MKERQFEENIIDIPAREKYLRDLENERRKQSEKAQLNQYNINYIKHQMDERTQLKKEFQTKDTLETMNLTQRAIQEFDEKEKAKKDYLSKIRQDNLQSLQRQIDERRSRMADEDKLNMNEANLNNYIGVVLSHLDQH